MFYRSPRALCIFRRFKDKVAPTVDICITVDIVYVNDCDVNYSYQYRSFSHPSQCRFYTTAKLIRSCSLLVYVSTFITRY